MLAKGCTHPKDAEEWKHAFLRTTPAELETPGKVCLLCSSST
jgi:hypothetical protein